jgi:hypothetical protein
MCPGKKDEIAYPMGHGLSRLLALRTANWLLNSTIVVCMTSTQSTVFFILISCP